MIELITFTIWITVFTISFVIYFGAKKQKGPILVQAAGEWINKSRWRMLIIGEMNVVVFTVLIYYLVQTDALTSIIPDPLMYSLGLLFTQNLLLILGILRASNYKPPSALSPMELLTAEILAHDEIEEGLEYVLSYIENNEENPESVIHELYQFLAIRDDEIGKVVRERLTLP